ncbi:MAG: hypothetical protein IPH04_02720 [Saprospirales bacterium]|nr:hypothetical protein [Saprospirales bacterium]
MENNTHEYHIVDLDGATIMSNLSPEHIEYYRDFKSTSEIISKCRFDGKRKRHGKLMTNSGTVYIISCSHIILNRAKNLRIYLDVYSQILESALSESKSIC